MLYWFSQSRLRIEKDSEWPSNYSSLNFYEPDYEEYPDFQDVNLKVEVRINPGDILRVSRERLF